MVLVMALKRDGLTAEIYFEDRDADVTARFEALYEQKGVFEGAPGTIPIWDDKSGRKAARIVVLAENCKDVSTSPDGPR